MTPVAQISRSELECGETPRGRTTGRAGGGESVEDNRAAPGKGSALRRAGGHRRCSTQRRTRKLIADYKSSGQRPIEFANRPRHRRARTEGGASQRAVAKKPEYVTGVNHLELIAEIRCHSRSLVIADLRRRTANELSERTPRVSSFAFAWRIRSSLSALLSNDMEPLDGECG